MKLDLNKFYNTNYKDFVHKEAVEEALKLVPEVELKDVDVDNILSITFSVDEYGENPMYIEYNDKEGKKHLVRIRPAVSNEIQEMLKRYVTLEQHETDKNAIYNHFERLNVPLELLSENGLDEEGNREVVLNNDNSFISFQVDPGSDNEIRWLCIHNKGGLGAQTQYFARFVDFAKVDEVPSNADFAEKVQELEEKMNTADNHVLEASKQYSDSTITSLGDELNVKIAQTKNELSVLIEEKTQDTLQQAKDYADTKDTEYFETSKRYTNNAKQEAIDESKAYTDSEADKTLDESKTYTDTKHCEVTQNLTELQDDVNSNYATKQELLTNVTGLNDYVNTNVQNLNDKVNTKATVYTATEGQQTISRYNEVTFEKMLSGDITFKAGRTAQAYGYLLNETQLAKLKNLNETPLGNPCDIKYNTSEDATEINFLPGSPDRVTVATADGIKMKSSFITIDQATNITNNTLKLSEIPNNGKATNIVWYPDGVIHYLRLLHDGEYVRTHIKDFGAQSSETIVYLPTFKSAKESELSNLNDKIRMIETMIATIGETTPIEMNIEYNGNSLELDNYSTYTTIGDTTIVNINCNFTAPFNSGSIPILNTLNITSETLKSFPLFMIDCIVKTATNVSSYTTTTTFSNKISSLYVETPVIESNETIATSLISFNGSFIFNNTSKESEE